MRNDIFHISAQNFPQTFPPKISFDESGEICGGAHEITPELAMKLGRACAELDARIAVGYSDCTLCKLLASGFISGAASSGAQITELGPSFFASVSFLARAYLFNLMVFFENDSQHLCIRITDKFGLPIEASMQRQIEAATAKTNIPSAGVCDVIMPKTISDSASAFISALKKRGALSGFSVSVSGNSMASDALRKVLVASGCEILEPQPGICELSVSDDGMKLFIRDEEEHWHDEGHTSALCVLIHFRSGKRELAVAPDSPSVFEAIAEKYNGKILRIGRDNGAKEIYFTQNLFSNAIASALAILIYLNSEEKSLFDLASELPEFTLVSREVSLKTDRKKLLKSLEESCSDMYSEHIGALRVCADGGWINIHPSRSSARLQITGEGFNEEIASELCSLFVERAESFDSSESKL